MQKMKCLIDMHKERDYLGFGFVEALLLIVIAGIACIVFLKIAAGSLVEWHKTERYDEVTRLTEETSEKVKIVLEQQRMLSEGDADVFPVDAVALNDCLAVAGTGDVFVAPSFKKNGSGSFIYTSCGQDIESCVSYADFAFGKTFSLFCVKKIDVDTGYVYGEVFAGFTQCDKFTLSGNNTYGECLAKMSIMDRIK